MPNRLALARVRRGRRLGFLTDAFALPSFAHRFVAALARGREFKNPKASCASGRQTAGRGALCTPPPSQDVNWLSAEQSNSSLTIGDA